MTIVVRKGRRDGERNGRVWESEIEDQYSPDRTKGSRDMKTHARNADGNSFVSQWRESLESFAGFRSFPVAGNREKGDPRRVGWRRDCAPRYSARFLSCFTSRIIRISYRARRWFCIRQPVTVRDTRTSVIPSSFTPPSMKLWLL